MKSLTNSVAALAQRALCACAVLSACLSPVVPARAQMGLLCERSMWRGAFQEARVWDIALQHQFAYLATNHGLIILDVTDPDNPERVGWHWREGRFQSVAVQWHRAFLCDDTNFTVYDVSNPTDPQPIGWLDLPSRAWEIDTIGHYAFVLTDDGIMVIDYADPANPEYRTTFAPDAQDVAYTEDARTCIVNEGYRIAAWDIRDRANPRYLGSHLTKTTIRDVAISGDLCLLVGANRFIVFDISDPSSLRRVSAVDGGGSPQSIAVDGDRALVVDDERLYVFDFGTPTLPRYMGRIISASPVQSLVLRGNFAYVANYLDDGLRIHDVSRPSYSPVIATLGPEYFGQPVASGDHVFYPGNELMILNAADSEHPVPAGSSVVGEGLLRLCACGPGLAGLHRASKQLRLFDVSDPSDIQLLGAASLGSSVDPTAGLTAHGDLVFVTGRNMPTRVFDISDPKHPVQLSSSIRSGTNPVYHKGVLFVISTYLASSVEAIDVSNPAAPVYLGSITFARGLTAINVHDDVLYVIVDEVPNSSDDALWLFDVSNPRGPEFLSTMPVFSLATEIGFYDGLAVITGQTGHTLLIDASNPLTPRLFFQSYVLLGSFCVHNGIAYGAAARLINLAPCSECISDINLDGVSNGTDVALFLDAYRSENPIADLNDDGLFNALDIQLFLTSYALGC